MIFDTDILIWFLRGNEKAVKLVDSTQKKYISVVTYMELIQGCRDKNELRSIKSFLEEMDFDMLPLTENTGHRASIYMEQYVLKSGMRMADALIASTAAEHAMPLATGNVKDYKMISEIELKQFHP